MNVVIKEEIEDFKDKMKIKRTLEETQDEKEIRNLIEQIYIELEDIDDEEIVTDYEEIVRALESENNIDGLKKLLNTLQTLN